jgi:integrase
MSDWATHPQTALRGMDPHGRPIHYDRMLISPQFIEGPLTKEYGLDNTEKESLLLEADDFREVIQYHWASDINFFPNERQRVQVAAILLLAAFTGSRPSALLLITYRDLRLYVERDRKTGKHELKLGVTLTKTKSGQKRKRP